ncbi:MAG: hypothetical protein HN405_05040 [Planctomycetes bacterium]|jgi:hypothetical protein|nr:hypothetical protein [Planctomycetota bacterium]MBT4028994.1 hypothetical protein [Planctomycetota bacterium]MBT4560262.1 hypothetical protein [Planctomycetota bacterium]
MTSSLHSHRLFGNTLAVIATALVLISCSSTSQHENTQSATIELAALETAILSSENTSLAFANELLDEWTQERMNTMEDGFLDDYFGFINQSGLDAIEFKNFIARLFYNDIPSNEEVRFEDFSHDLEKDLDSDVLLDSRILLISDYTIQLHSQNIKFAIALLKEHKSTSNSEILLKLDQVKAEQFALAKGFQADAGLSAELKAVLADSDSPISLDSSYSPSQWWKYIRLAKNARLAAWLAGPAISALNLGADIWTKGQNIEKTLPLVEKHLKEMQRQYLEMPVVGIHSRIRDCTIEELEKAFAD